MTADARGREGRNADFADHWRHAVPLLMEGAVAERAKREHDLLPDEHVAMAGAVCNARGRQALSGIWREYLRVAADHDLAFMATTPTRRANRERVAASSFDAGIIGENCAFLRGIRDQSPTALSRGKKNCTRRRRPQTQPEERRNRRNWWKSTEKSRRCRPESLP